MGPPTLLKRGAIAAHPDVIPIDWIKGWLRKRMPQNGSTSASIADRVLVVKAETGSGKSTAMPVEIFRMLRDPRTAAAVGFKDRGVVCTQPRVLTAIETAKDLASDVDDTGRRIYPDINLDATIGYQTGPVRSGARMGLMYATAGVLAMQLLVLEDSDLMSLYQFIIVDEVHERTLECDLILLQLKNFYRRNEGNLRLPFLILTSATIDPIAYAHYFGLGAENTAYVIGAPHPITEHWPEHGSNNYPVEAAAMVGRILATANDAPGKGDVLIFMPGAAELKSAKAALEALKLTPPPKILVIEREVVAAQTGDYLLIKSVSRERRIILSTAVAETGLTIPTLRYVIDCGWDRSNECYQPWGGDGLLTRPAAQSRIRQRRGRVGRKFSGDFYPLYTENVHKSLDPAQLADIVSKGFVGGLLPAVQAQQRHKLRMHQVPEFRLEHLGMLDPPPAEAFIAAYSQALLLGFMSVRAALPTNWPPNEVGEVAPLTTTHGCGLTPLGFVAARFSSAPMCAVRVLMAGYVWRVAASDLATVVAMHRAQRGFASLRVKGAALKLGEFLPAFLCEAGYAHAGPVVSLLLADDFALAVLIVDAFLEHLALHRDDIRRAAEICERAGLDYLALVDVLARREQVIEEQLVAGLNPFRLWERRLAACGKDAFSAVLGDFKRCLYDGLHPFLLQYRPGADGDGYYNLQGVKVQTPPDLATKAVTKLRDAGVVAAEHGDWHPKWLVTDQLLIAVAKSTKLPAPMTYEVKANMISVLDGYVSPDESYASPRTFAPGGEDKKYAGVDLSDPAAAGRALRTYYDLLTACDGARGWAPEKPARILSDDARSHVYVAV